RYSRLNPESVRWSGRSLNRTTSAQRWMISDGLTDFFGSGTFVERRYGGAAFGLRAASSAGYPPLLLALSQKNRPTILNQAGRSRSLIRFDPALCIDLDSNQAVRV